MNDDTIYIIETILCEDCKNKLTHEGAKLELRHYHDKHYISCCHVSPQTLMFPKNEQIKLGYCINET